MVFRILNGLMALLFLLAVAVQYNDPDPIRWMLLYGAAMVVAAVVAIKGYIPMMAPSAVCVVALVWGIYWAVTSGTPFALYEHMFDAWEMKNTAIEEAREASGLLIVAFWMAVIAVWSRRSLHV